MSEQIRALDLRKDLDDLVVLFEICFADEMANRGGDFREQLASYRRLMPLLSLLGRFSNSFRHLLDGFVWEEDGRIVAIAFRAPSHPRTAH